MGTARTKGTYEGGQWKTLPGVAPQEGDTVVTQRPVANHKPVNDQGVVVYQGIQPECSEPMEISSSFLLDDLEPDTPQQRAQKTGQQSTFQPQAAATTPRAPLPAPHTSTALPSVPLPAPVPHAAPSGFTPLSDSAAGLSFPSTPTDLGAAQSSGVPVSALDERTHLSHTMRIREELPQEPNWTMRAAIAVVAAAGIVAGFLFDGGDSDKPASAQVPAVVATGTPASPIVAPLNGQVAAKPAAVTQTDSEEMAAAEPEVVIEPEVVAEEVVAEEEVQPEAEALLVEELEEKDSDAPTNAAEEAEAEMDMVAEDVDDITPKRPSRKRSKVVARKKVSKGKAHASSKKGGHGVLMLGAKPPCKIFVDGKNTGLMTPQRNLKLPAGKHRITLVNMEHRVRSKFQVDIKAGKQTKVIRDLTSKLK